MKVLKVSDSIHMQFKAICATKSILLQPALEAILQEWVQNETELLINSFKKHGSENK